MTDSATRPTSRRAVLAGAAGGALAAAVGSLARPEPAAAVDTPMLLNAVNASSASTFWVANIDTNTSTVYGLSMNATPSAASSLVAIRGAATVPNGGATGLEGEANGVDAMGVRASANGSGSSTVWGVYASSYSAAGKAIGVQGSADIGVYGEGEQGIGVLGYTETGTSFFAQVISKATGIGIEAQGRIRFPNRSGRATIKATKSSVKVSVPGVTSTNIAIATLGNSRTNRWVRAAVCSAGAVTIHLNGSVGNDTKVAWLILG